MIVGIGRVQRDRFVQNIHGGFVTPFAVRHRPQDEVDVGIFRIDLDDAAETPLDFAQIAELGDSGPEGEQVFLTRHEHGSRLDAASRGPSMAERKSVDVKSPGRERRGPGPSFQM